MTRNLIEERATEKRYYDRKVNIKKKVSTFQPRQRVAVQDERTKEWSKYGRIVEEIEPRSFKVKLDDGGEIRRNQRYIRKLYCITQDVDVQGERTWSDNEEEEADYESEGSSTIEYDLEDAGYRDEMMSMIDDAIEERRMDDYVMFKEETKNTGDKNGHERSTYGRVRRKKKPLDYDDL